MLNHQYFLNNIKGVWLISPLILLLSACSIGVTPSEQNMPLALPFGVEVQSMRTTPAIGSRIIDESQLEAGDILLSRSPNVTSLGVRAFTTSSVSHASLYIGDGLVAEAIRSGVRTIDLPHVIDESMMVAVYRYPDLATIDKVKIREFSLAQVGKKYNFKGIIFMMPYSFTRQLCELPPMREKTRNGCLYYLASAQLGSLSSDKQSFFCSQFVLEAYNYAGQPITESAPTWVSPDDLMHMREGDIKSITPHKELIYVGHLKIEVRPPAQEKL
jgi:hypothetical protein